jgi:hypothetical protein
MAKKQADNPYADIGAEDNPYADIGAGPTAGEVALDVAKQVPSSLIAGVEQIPAAPAHAANLITGLVGPYIEKAADYFRPGKGAEMQEAELQRQRLLAQVKGLKGTAADYLPEPQTPLGKVVRTAGEVIPSAVAGSTYSIPRALAVGAGTGALSEVGGQAVEGTDLETPVRVGALLVGGHVGGRLAERGATTGALEAGKTAARTGADRGYQTFRDADFNIHPDLGTNFARTVRTDLENTGRNEITAPDTLKALNRIEAKPFATPQEIQRDYQMLGHVVADNTAKASDRMAARIAQERLLTEVETKGAQHLMPGGTAYATPGGSVAFARMVPEEAVQTFQKANQDWAALKRAENLDQRITKGELRAGSNYSGLNLENELRRRVSVLADKDVGRGFSPAERAAFEQYGRGNVFSNAPRYIKNFMGGGGGLGALIGGAGAVGAGQYFGFDPATAGGATILGGLGLAKYGNMRALNRARELELMLLRRSPSAQAAGIPGTRSGGAASVLAPTLSTLGE